MRHITIGHVGVVFLGLLAGGCDGSSGGGITNPNPGSMSGGEKASVRTDTPVPNATSGKDQGVVEAAGSRGGVPASDSADQPAGKAPTPPVKP